ncbi:MAG: HlyC/CorC family transporter [Chloroflexales bacterium]|nr:HlyC/CorC family transporter [Chloroflexales bacterium]
MLLILANGFFAASEIAIVSAREARLQQQAERGERGARAALALAADPSRFLAAVQVGITLVSTFAAAFGGERLATPLAQALEGLPVVGPYAYPLAFAIVVLAISYLSLIIGELVPKSLALQQAEATARFAAPIMTTIARFAAPVVSFLTLSSNLVLRLLGRTTPADESVTEDDVLALVRAGAKGGTLEHEEHTLISGIFSFTDQTVGAVMTPRTTIFALDVATPLRTAVAAVADSGYSRVPIYNGSIEDVVGVLHARDLLRFCISSPPTEGDAVVALNAFLREPLVLIESQRAPAAFKQLQQAQAHLAIVLDEYGQVAGIVTLEDFLEELVGEIDDEHDEVSRQVVRRDDGSFLVDGRLAFAEAQRALALPPLDAEFEAGFNTMAGFALALFGHLPAVGETVQWQGYLLEVVDMDGRRIDKLLVRPPAE